jgi:hypothetical protein
MIIHGCIEIHLKYCRGWIIIIGFQGFINHAIFNPMNISRGNIRFLYKRCKNKKFLDPDIITMYFL